LIRFSDHHEVLRLKMAIMKFPTRAAVTLHRLRIRSKSLHTDSSNDFITSLAVPLRPELEALAAMVNAEKPASFHDSVLVARQVLDSGRDLAIIPLKTFQELCRSELRNQLCQFRNQLCQLLVNARLTSYPAEDVLKAVPLLRASIPVSELVATAVAPSGPLAVFPSAPLGPQNLLLTLKRPRTLIPSPRLLTVLRHGTSKERPRS